MPIIDSGWMGFPQVVRADSQDLIINVGNTEGMCGQNLKSENVSDKRTEKYTTLGIWKQSSVKVKK